MCEVETEHRDVQAHRGRCARGDIVSGGVRPEVDVGGAQDVDAEPDVEREVRGGGGGLAPRREGQAVHEGQGGCAQDERGDEGKEGVLSNSGEEEIVVWWRHAAMDVVGFTEGSEIPFVD